MAVLKIKNGLKTDKEIWFHKEPMDNLLENFYERGVSFLLFKESWIKLDGRFSPFRNAFIPLDKELGLIFENFNKGFRNEVRRGGKEGIKCAVMERSELAFSGMFRAYRRFSKEKKIPFLRRHRLEAYSNSGKLDVSIAVFEEQVLQYHIYFRDVTEVVLLASFPNLAAKGKVQQKVLGWANRSLHWEDISRFQKEGVSIYNLGGIGNPVTDANRHIVNFKMEMSPEIKEYFQAIIPVSFLGRLLLQLRKHLTVVPTFKI